MVVVTSPAGGIKHGGIHLSVHGQVSFQMSARNIGVFEALYSSLKPLDLVKYELEVCGADRCPPGVTEYPFEFVLRPNQPGAEDLFETYRGVYVNVQYMTSVELRRSFPAKTIKVPKEFLVEMHSERNRLASAAGGNSSSMEAFASSVGDEEVVALEQQQQQPASAAAAGGMAGQQAQQPAAAQRFNFKVSPQALQNVKQSSKRKIPDFLFEGHLERTAVNIHEPLLGELTIKHCAVEIRSIELQLVRVESYSHMDDEAREATEIQNIQIADGNPIRGLPIPIHMVFPRLFTCVSTKTRTFKVQFEVNLIVLFHGDHMVTENLPIVLWR